MKEINKSVLKDASSRLLFDMTEDQYAVLEKEFAILMKQMDLIGKIEGVDDIEPMTFPFDVINDVLRDDVPSVPLPREIALQNAKDIVDGQIKLPKVVG